MNWITNHLDAVIFALAFFIACSGYMIGREVGYRAGLEDGFSDGKLNATR